MFFAQQIPPYSIEVFNFISVAVSIVLGLGLTCLLNDISRVIQNWNRVKLYWVHCIWVAVIIGLHFQLWYGFWIYHSVPRWTFLSFVGYMLAPALLFLIADLLFPELVASEVDDQRFDLRTYYNSIHTPLFATLSAYLITVTALTIFLKPSNEFPIVPMLCRLAGITCAVLAMIFRSEAVHGVLVIVVLALFLLFVCTAHLQPLTLAHLER